MKHYVYLLINPNNDMKYIGKRSCECLPEEDVSYMSSSIYVPKEECDKLILKEFDTAKEAVEYEVRLHKKFNVATNPEFYNRANQTSNKFDTTGMTFNLTDEQKEKISKGNTGKKRSAETVKQMTEHLAKYRTQENRLKAAETLKQNGSNKGIKNSQFKPWFISYHNVTHLFYDISKNEKALQNGFTKKYYTDTAKKCKQTGLPVTNRKGETIFVDNIPN